MIIILFLFLGAFGVLLNDGESVLGTHKIAAHDIYTFKIIEKSETNDLSIFLTSFEDGFQPEIYASRVINPTISLYEYKSDPFGPPEIRISSNDIKAGDIFNIFIHCVDSCYFYLTVDYVNHVHITAEIPMIRHINPKESHVYVYEVSYLCSRPNLVEIHPNRPSVTLKIENVSFESVASEKLIVIDLFDEGKQSSFENYSGQKYKIEVSSGYDSFYYLSISCGDATLVPLSVGIPGRILKATNRAYKIHLGETTTDMFIYNTNILGETDIATKSSGIPTESSNHYYINVFDNGLFRIQNIWLQPEKFYFISALGYTDCDYIINIARLGSISLIPSIPTTGTVIPSKILLFKLIMPKLEDYLIRFSLDVKSGNPDIFIKLCNKTQSECFFSQDEIENPVKYQHIYFSSKDEALEDLYISHSKLLCKSSCQYLIGIRGSSNLNSKFLLTAHYDKREILLPHGQTISGFLFEPVHYKFSPFFEINSAELLISYDYCNLDAFVSNDIAFPDVSSSDDNIYWKKPNMELIRYSEITNINNYHLSLNSKEQCAYSIISIISSRNSKNPIELSAGIPVQGTLVNNEYENKDYYYIVPNLNDNFGENNYNQEIRISILPISPDFEVSFIKDAGLMRQNTTFDYLNYDKNSGVLTTNEVRKTIGIIISTDKFPGENIREYSISYQMNDVYTLLIENTAQIDEILEKNYNYYQYEISKKSTVTDLTVSVTVFTGDPDLYIKIGKSKPDQNNFDFRSNKFGADIFTIEWEKIIELCKTDMCVITIGVFGYSNSKYSILLTTSKYNPTLMYDGIPQIGHVDANNFAYYYTFIKTDTPLFINSQSLQGDSDLYLRIIDIENEGYSYMSWSRVSKDQYDYSSLSTLIEDRITLGLVEIKEKCQDKGCAVLVGVHCFNENCDYSITYSQSSAVILTENKPSQGFCKPNNHPNQYTYENLQQYANISISVTLFSGENLVVYINYLSPATSSNFIWNINTYSNNYISITPDYEIFKLNNRMNGVFFISIECQHESEYSLLINTHKNPVIPLYEGQPQTTYIAENYPAHFSFLNSINSNITIKVTQDFGSSKIYVSTCDTNNPNVELILPNKKSYI